MTDVQLYLAIGLPILTILVSLTVSLVQIGGIREEVRIFRSDMRDEMRGLRSDVRQDIQSLRADLTMVTGKVIEIDNRLIRIEERLEHR